MEDCATGEARQWEEEMRGEWLYEQNEMERAKNERSETE